MLQKALVRREPEVGATHRKVFTGMHVTWKRLGIRIAEGFKLKRLFVSLAGLLIFSTAQAATAYWTGNMQFVTTVTFKSGVSCEYNFSGHTFWRTFTGGSCPSTVEVE